MKPHTLLNYQVGDADGSGFTRLLQSLALMCSNQPGLPMTFGAANLSHPEVVIGKEAFAGCDNITQVCAHTPADDSSPFTYAIASCGDILTHYQLCKRDASEERESCVHINGAGKLQNAHMERIVCSMTMHIPSSSCAGKHKYCCCYDHAQQKCNICSFACCS